MKIAVCDNDEITTRQTVSMLEDYMEEKNIGLTYEVFSSYESVADRIEDFDLFFLDYNMNDDSVSADENGLMNGMNFAKLIRSSADPHKGIIFLTSYKEIVYECFEVRAYRFLLKPLSREKLFKALDAYLDSTVETGTILVKYNDEAHIIDISSIYFFEVIRKDIFIHLENEVIKCRKTIDSFEKELSSLGFFRTHRSYLVNISMIDTINRKSAVLKNGEEVYVSGKKYAELCEKFLEKG